MGCSRFIPRDLQIPPADRQTLTHCVLKAELGKPVFLLYIKDSRLRPMGMRVEEAGKSECQPVMGWIRVPNLPGSKESRLPAWC